MKSTNIFILCYFKTYTFNSYYFAEMWGQTPARIKKILSRSSNNVSRSTTKHFSEGIWHKIWFHTLIQKSRWLWSGSVPPSALRLGLGCCFSQVSYNIHTHILSRLTPIGVGRALSKTRLLKPCFGKCLG